MYFDDAQLPDTLDWVEHDFPFPLAVTYRRVWKVIRDQQPVEAAWTVRDAIESFAKFVASVALADFVATTPGETGPAMNVLFNSRGLAIGHWTELLAKALVPLNAHARDGTLADSGRALHGLFNVFYTAGKAKPTPTPVLRLLSGGDDGFETWRNKVFGHGVFKESREGYAAEAVKWLKHLHTLYEAVKPVFGDRRLTATTAGNETVDWQGCEFSPAVEQHRHQPLGPPLPMAFGSVALGPLLSVQPCAGCDHPMAFYFDRHKTEKKAVCLEYLAGHTEEATPWEQVLAWRQHRTEPWVRQVYHGADLVRAMNIQFRDFDRDYLPPEHLVETVRGLLADPTIDQGYIHLTGPEGVGKSYFVRGLAEKQAGFHPVFRLHLDKHHFHDMQRFAVQLREVVAERFPNVKQIDLQIKGTEPGRPVSGELAEYLAKVQEMAGLDVFVLALDGLDELPDAGRDRACVLDLLPPADELPAGCFVLLTGRPQMADGVQDRLTRLRDQCRQTEDKKTVDRWRTVPLDPLADGNRELVRGYLLAKLPEEVRTAAAAEQVLALSGGVFLFAAHYVRALEQGAFPTLADLPPPDAFYPRFLDSLRERVGDHLYESAYLPVLLCLCAARVPVTLEQLGRWVQPADRLPAVLVELRDFIREIRHREFHEGLGDDTEPRYKIAHEAFVRFVETHEAERLKDAHHTIATVALRHNDTQWEDLDPADNTDLYDVRFVLLHCDKGGMTAQAEALRGDDVLVACIWRTADRLTEFERIQLALELFEQCEVIYCLQIDCGRIEHSGSLAMVLMNKGNAILSLGQPQESLLCYGEAIDILYPLIKLGHVEFVDQYAHAMINSGNALQKLGQLDEAITVYDHAVRQLAGLEGSDTSRKMATALANKGVALKALGRLTQSLQCLDEAVRIWNMVSDDEQGGSANELASALMNRGVTRLELRQLGEAEGDFDLAIVHSRRLVQAGREDSVKVFVNAVMNRGIALSQQGRFADSLACYDEALTHLRRMVARGWGELVEVYAKTYLCKGITLTQMKLQPEAAECLESGSLLLLELFNCGQLTTLADLIHAVRIRFEIAVVQNDWSTAALRLEAGLSSYVTKMKSSGITDAEKHQVVTLLRLLVSLSSQKRQPLLSVASPMLTDFLNTIVFTTPPPPS